MEQAKEKKELTPEQKAARKRSAQKGRAKTKFNSWLELQRMSNEEGIGKGTAIVLRKSAEDVMKDLKHSEFINEILFEHVAESMKKEIEK